MAENTTPIKLALPPCGDCPEVFGQLRIMPTICRGTRVEWSLHPRFTDPQPHTFQLQFGRTGNPLADDWSPVGLPAVNTYFLEDDEPRVFGKTQWTHYRIQLETGSGLYYSAPISAHSSLSFRDWRRVREMMRAHNILLREEEGSEGYLLKRRLFGEPCPNNCVDYLTEDVSNPNCPICYGTGFLGGYYDPLECVYAALSQNSHDTEIDGLQARGTIDDLPRVPARLLAIPQLVSRDVWVRKNSDERWEIRKPQHAAEYRGWPIIYTVEMRLLPFSNPVYAIELPGQLPS